MTFLCSLCDYKTLDYSNYKKHLKTRKHIKNEEQNTKIEEKTTDTEEKTTCILQNRTESSSILNCRWCKRYFSRSDNLQRHMMMCRIKSVQKCPEVSNNEEQSTTGLQCQYCKNSYCNKRSLSKHIRLCFLRNNQQIELRLYKQQVEMRKLLGFQVLKLFELNRS